VPVGFATIYVGPFFAFALAIFAIVVSKGGDLLAGMPYPGNAIFIWNAAIAISFCVIVICLLHMLNRVLLGLEATVQRRNKDLLQEMTNRAQLEREMIGLSEQERRRFGQELHELVSQDLAGVAIEMHLLTRNLLAAEQDEAQRAREIALRVDRSLSRARSLARGSFTVGLDTIGLADALREIGAQVEKAHHISCEVRCQEDFLIGNEDATVQLFRIAQEAIRNAVLHAGASLIKVTFERKENEFRLTVEDNGRGLVPSIQTKGIGLRIMAYRANLIGGVFQIENASGGGTIIICSVPFERLAQKSSPSAVGRSSQSS
jgi:signal transduction histidine kinase